MKSLVLKKCGITDHKLLMGGGIFLMGDISPIMSASIPADSAWPFLTCSAFIGINLRSRRSETFHH